MRATPSPVLSLHDFTFSSASSLHRFVTSSFSVTRFLSSPVSSSIFQEHHMINVIGSKIFNEAGQAVPLESLTADALHAAKANFRADSAELQTINTTIDKINKKAELARLLPEHAALTQRIADLQSSLAS
jgi:hypothetical protein